MFFSACYSFCESGSSNSSAAASKQRTKTQPWASHEHFGWLNSPMYAEVLRQVVADAFDDRSRECLRVSPDVSASPHAASVTRLHVAVHLLSHKDVANSMKARMRESLEHVHHKHNDSVGCCFENLIREIKNQGNSLRSHL